MNQTKIESLIESSVNIGSGWFVSLLLWIFVVTPWMDIEPILLDSLAVTGLFTVVSIIRSYLWRRFFNAGFHRVVHQAVISAKEAVQ